MTIRRAVAAATAVVFGASAVAGATAGSEAQTAGQAYKVVGGWGKLGQGNGQFGGNAFGLATAKNGDVYVADSDNRRIQRFSASGAFKGKIPFGNDFVPDVAVDADGNVWGTTDTSAGARRFTPDGQSLASVTTPKQALGIGADAEGHVYVATSSDDVHVVVRYDKTGGEYTQGKSWGGFRVPGDVEVAADGAIWVTDSEMLVVKRFDANGKLLKTIKAGPSNPIGIGADLDCNVWVTNIAQRRLDRYSPSGRLIGTAAAPDLIAEDVAIGPSGDLYAYDGGTHSMIHFAENKAKPGLANVPGKLKVVGGAVSVKYTASGFACPAEISATASLSGGVTGKTSLKVLAGKTTVIRIPVKVPKGAASATFKIVLKTNGRPTTETRRVTVSP